MGGGPLLVPCWKSFCSASCWGLTAGSLLYLIPRNLFATASCWRLKFFFKISQTESKKPLNTTCRDMVHDVPRHGEVQKTVPVEKLVSEKPVAPEKLVDEVPKLEEPALVVGTLAVDSLVPGEDHAGNNTLAVVEDTLLPPALVEVHGGKKVGPLSDNTIEEEMAEIFPKSLPLLPSTTEHITYKDSGDYILPVDTTLLPSTPPPEIPQRTEHIPLSVIEEETAETPAQVPPIVGGLPPSSHGGDRIGAGNNGQVRLVPDYPHLVVKTAYHDHEMLDNEARILKKLLNEPSCEATVGQSVGCSHPTKPLQMFGYRQGGKPELFLERGTVFQLPKLENREDLMHLLLLMLLAVEAVHAKGVVHR